MTMARTYKTLSLSLPPNIVEQFVAIGKSTGRTGARVAAEIVLRAIARIPEPKLVLPESIFGERRWIPAIALLCSTCGKQMHGREYEGWIADV